MIGFDDFCNVVESFLTPSKQTVETYQSSTQDVPYDLMRMVSQSNVQS